MKLSHDKTQAFIFSAAVVTFRRGILTVEGSNLADCLHSCLRDMDQLAERYDAVQRDYQGKDGKELIDKLTLKEGCSVLDLGCGTGYLTSLLGERVGQRGTVTGFDPDAARIAVARRNHGELKNVTFLAGSSEDFPSGLYDLIFSNHVIHWIEDKETAFRKIHGDLTDDGVFAFVCATETDQMLWDILKPAIKQLFHLCGKDVYDNLAHKCGFRTEFREVVPIKYVYNTVDQFLEYVIPSVSDPAGLQENAVEKLKNGISSRKQIYLNWKRASVIMRKEKAAKCS